MRAANLVTHIGLVALVFGVHVACGGSGNNGSTLTNPYSPDPYADNDRVFLRMKYSF